MSHGKPEPRRVTHAVLWAYSDNYPGPQFVSAWSDYQDENYRALYRSNGEQTWRELAGDESWQFFVTIEPIAQPERPAA